MPDEFNDEDFDYSEGEEVDLSGMSPEDREELDTGQKPLLPEGHYILRVKSVTQKTNTKSGATYWIISNEVIRSVRPAHEDPVDDHEEEQEDFTNRYVTQMLYFQKSTLKIQGLVIRRIAGKLGDKITLLPSDIEGKYFLAHVTIRKHENYEAKNDIGFGIKYIPKNLQDELDIEAPLPPEKSDRPAANVPSTKKAKKTASTGDDSASNEASDSDIPF